MRRVLIWSLLVFIIFSCLAILLTYPLVSNLSHDYFNPTTPHDGVGTIALYWYKDYARQHGLSGTRTNFWAYPWGYDLHDLADPLSGGVLGLMSSALGPQVAFNILVILSFPLAGLLMFLLIYYITGSSLASLLGGLIYAFSPWHTARVYNQISLSMIYVLPLFLIAVVFFWRRRSIVSGLAVTAALVVAVYTDYHFGVFCGLIFIAWGIAALINHRVETGHLLRGARPLLTRKTARTVLLAVLAVVLALAIAAPLLKNLLYKDPTVIASSGERSIDTTVNYSSRMWNYEVPPSYALIWRWWTTDYVFTHENKAGSHEMTAYPGIVTYALAFVAIFLTFRRRRKKSGDKKEGGDGEGDSAGEPEAGKAPVETDAAVTARARVVRTAVYFGIVAGILAFILSMPPLVTVGTVRIPTPSIIMRVIAPLFRFYSRWALVVTFALSLLASIGFYLLRLKRSWSPRKAAVICLVIIALFAIDVTVVPPLRAKDITKVPKAVTDLARYPKSEPVIYYPMVGQYFIPLQYRYYQTFNEHPMLNGVATGTIGDFYQGVLKDIYAPYTPHMLSGLGIKKAVVIPALYKQILPVGIDFDPRMMPPGYKLLEKASDSYIYEITASPATLFPLYYTNFSGSLVLEDGKAWNALLSPSGELLIQNKGGPATADFSITVNNPGKEGMLSMDLDGTPLGSTRIAPGEGTVKVPLKLEGKEQTLTISWDGRPVSENGKVVGLSGHIPVYLFLTRPQFNQTGI